MTATAISPPPRVEDSFSSPARSVRSPLRTDLRLSVADGVSFSLMVGLGETYLPAFVLFLGLGEVVSGLIATVPVFIGSLLQLASPGMVARLRSYRRWVVLCASVQALSFVPLVAAAVAGTMPNWAVIAIASIYWAAGLAAGPAWNSWMGTMVPARIQTQFFTVRTRWTQVAALVGFVGGGIVLHQSDFGISKATAFALLFLSAGTFRAISVLLIRGQSESIIPANEGMRPFCLTGFLRSLKQRDVRGRALLYLLAIQFTSQFASPYFTPFMLKELELSYSRYAILIAASFIAKALVLPALGKYARGYGVRNLLWFGGVGIVFMPGLWLLTDEFNYLLLFQALSGVFWAAYDLAALLLIFEIISPKDRTWMLTAYNVAASASMAFAAVLGALTLRAVGGGRFGYEVVFLISTVARAGTLFLLHGVAPRSRLVLPIAFRTLAVRPGFGAFGLPLISAGIRSWRKRITRAK